jgi:hypothetical protein
MLIRDVTRELERKHDLNGRCRHNVDCRRVFAQQLTDLRCNMNHKPMFDNDRVIASVRPVCDVDTKRCVLNDVDGVKRETQRMLLRGSEPLLNVLINVFKQHRFVSFNDDDRRNHEMEDIVDNVLKRVMRSFDDDDDDAINVEELLNELLSMMATFGDQQLNEQDVRLLEQCMTDDVIDGVRQCRRRLNSNKSKYC